MEDLYSQAIMKKTAADKRPIVGLMANSSEDSGLAIQTVDDKYLSAVLQAVGAVPLVLPTLLGEYELSAVLPVVDGLILTGDASNIHPYFYGKEGTQESHGPFDKKRDTAAFALIQAAFEQNIPLLGICRGMQEMNVALGGTIRNDLFENEVFSRHHPIDYAKSPELRYDTAHSLQLCEDGLLKCILGEGQYRVNSLHEQAVDILGEGLVLDASSEDGVIEAFHHPAKRFFLGVQWHAEFAAIENDVSGAIFEAFADVMKVSSTQEQKFSHKRPINR